MAHRPGMRLSDASDLPDDEFLSIPEDDEFHSIPDELCRSSSSSSIDSVENVDGQTEQVVASFMHARYIRSVSIDAQGFINVIRTPTLPEQCGLTSEQTSVTSALGRELADIGDDINERYGQQFDDMFRRLNLAKLCMDGAYNSFAQVARKLFENGVSWGGIVALLCFGFRAAMQLAHCGLPFLKKIIQYVVTFIAKEQISTWIAEQGGWVAAHAFVTSLTASNSTIAIIVVAAVVSTALAYFFARHR